MNPPAAQKLFGDLVRIVERDWRRVGYVQRDFPAIAVNALLEVAPHRNLDALGALAAIGAGDGSETHVGSHASVQVIPVYGGPRFSMALHAWPDEVGTPHSHSWCGAYQVLSGTSISGSYAFTEQTPVDAKFALGSLERTRFEFLPTGSTLPVYRGHDMIHGLTYVDRLGISLSIRTNENPEWVTSEFLPPGVRVDLTKLDRVVQQQVKSLEALFAIDPDRAARALERLLRRADARSCFLLLKCAFEGFADFVDPRRLWQAAEPVFGANVTVVKDALAFFEKENVLRSRRAGLVDDDHRCLLAVLHMAQTRADVERLLAERAATRGLVETPAAFIARCVREMASTPAESGLTLLGTPRTSDFHVVLGLLLEDSRTETVLKRLEADYDPQEVRQLAPVVRQACETLRALPLLRPLFTGQAAPA